MRPSLRIARILGIDVQIHWSFFAVFGVVGLLALLAGQPVVTVASSALFLAALFACVVLHEFGHALAARQFGIPTRDITLLPIGGLARLERMPRRPFEEFVIAIAGPAVNVVIALLLLVPILLTAGVSGLLSPTGAVTRFAVNLLLINVVMTVFNLLPAFPMDGGRVLRALLGWRLDFAKATRIAASVGQVMAIGFALLALFVVGNPLLLGISAFVFIAAGREAEAARLWHRINGLQARHATSMKFLSVSPYDSVQEAARRMLLSGQAVMPISLHGDYLGALTARRVSRAFSQAQRDVPVAELEDVDLEPVAPSDSLVAVSERMQLSRQRELPVVEGRWLVGLISQASVETAFAPRPDLPAEVDEPVAHTDDDSRSWNGLEQAAGAR